MTISFSVTTDPLIFDWKPYSYGTSWRMWVGGWLWFQVKVRR